MSTLNTVIKTHEDLNKGHKKGCLSIDHEVTDFALQGILMAKFHDILLDMKILYLH